MPSQEPISPGQIKPESCREPQTSSRLQQTNVNLQAPRNGVNGYSIGQTTVMASDGCSAEKASFQGFFLSLSVPSETEADRAFAALADGGQVGCLWQRRSGPPASAWWWTVSASAG